MKLYQTQFTLQINFVHPEKSDAEMNAVYQMMKNSIRAIAQEHGLVESPRIPSQTTQREQNDPQQ